MSSQSSTPGSTSFDFNPFAEPNTMEISDLCSPLTPTPDVNRAKSKSSNKERHSFVKSDLKSDTTMLPPAPKTSVPKTKDDESKILEKAPSSTVTAQLQAAKPSVSKSPKPKSGAAGTTESSPPNQEGSKTETAKPSAPSTSKDLPDASSTEKKLSSSSADASNPSKKEMSANTATSVNDSSSSPNNQQASQEGDKNKILHRELSTDHKKRSSLATSPPAQHQSSASSAAASSTAAKKMTATESNSAPESHVKNAQSRKARSSSTASTQQQKQKQPTVATTSSLVPSPHPSAKSLQSKQAGAKKKLSPAPTTSNSSAKVSSVPAFDDIYSDIPNQMITPQSDSMDVDVDFSATDALSSATSKLQHPPSKDEKQTESSRKRPRSSSPNQGPSKKRKLTAAPIIQEQQSSPELELRRDLIRACLQNQYSDFKQLVQSNKEKITWTDGSNETLLHKLVPIKGRAKFIKLVLENWPTNGTINCQSSATGNTALHELCSKNLDPSYLVLFTKRNDTQTALSNFDKVIPIQFACEAQGFVKRQKDRCIDELFEHRDCRVSTKDIKRWKKHSAILKSRPNRVLPPEDHSKFLTAVGAGQVASVKKTVKKYRIQGVRDAKGRTALQICALNGNPTLLQLLLKLPNVELEPGLQNLDGDTALHCAAIGCRPATLQTLATTYPKLVSMTNNVGNTPFHESARRLDTKSVLFFVNMQGITMAQNQNALTPLHYAILADKCPLKGAIKSNARDVCCKAICAKTQQSMDECERDLKKWGLLNLESPKSTTPINSNQPQSKPQQVMQHTTSIIDRNSTQSKKRKSMSPSPALAIHGSTQPLKKRRSFNDQALLNHHTISFESIGSLIGQSPSLKKEPTFIGINSCVEKDFLRSSANMQPSRETVRPLIILKKAFNLIQEKFYNGFVDYKTYILPQMKSIRQDLTIQRIFNDFTIQVYESHARLTLLHKDVGEFNQCQSQLMKLYKEKHLTSTHKVEFYCYWLIYSMLSRDPSAHLFYQLLSKDTLQHPNIILCLQALRVYHSQNIGKFLTMCVEIEEKKLWLCHKVFALFLDDIRERYLMIIAKSHSKTKMGLNYLISCLSLNLRRGNRFFQRMKIHNLKEEFSGKELEDALIAARGIRKGETVVKNKDE